METYEVNGSEKPRMAPGQTEPKNIISEIGQSLDEHDEWEKPIVANLRANYHDSELLDTIAELATIKAGDTARFVVEVLKMKRAAGVGAPLTLPNFIQGLATAARNELANVKTESDKAAENARFLQLHSAPAVVAAPEVIVGEAPVRLRKAPLPLPLCPKEPVACRVAGWNPQPLDPKNMPKTNAEICVAIIAQLCPEDDVEANALFFLQREFREGVPTDNLDDALTKIGEMSPNVTGWVVEHIRRRRDPYFAPSTSLGFGKWLFCYGMRRPEITPILEPPTAETHIFDEPDF